MWVEYPKDPDTFEIQDQFMVGRELLVKPVVTQNQQKTPVYLPSAHVRNKKCQLYSWPVLPSMKDASLGYLLMSSSKNNSCGTIITPIRLMAVLPSIALILLFLRCPYSKEEVRLSFNAWASMGAKP